MEARPSAGPVISRGERADVRLALRTDKPDGTSSMQAGCSVDRDNQPKGDAGTAADI
jgi:hypothetical protein